MNSSATISFWGARAPRVLVIASSRSRTFPFYKIGNRKDGCGETPQPARETRALPDPRD